MKFIKQAGYAVGVTAGAWALGAGCAVYNAATTAEPAEAAVACGGNQTVHLAPIDCVGSSVIDGTLITGHVEESAGLLKVTFTLDNPRVTDTPIRLRWHVGLSSTGTVPAETSGVIPAGQTVGVLSVRSPVCRGQIDAKAVFIANGDKRGRVTAPWITDNNCTATPPTTAPATTTPASTVPGTTSPSTPSTAPGQTTPPSSVSGTVIPGPLPATGGGSDSGPLAWAGGALLVLGLVMREVHLRVKRLAD